MNRTAVNRLTELESKNSGLLQEKKLFHGMDYDEVVSRLTGIEYEMILNVPLLQREGKLDEINEIIAELSPKLIERKKQGIYFLKVEKHFNDYWKEQRHARENNGPDDARRFSRFVDYPRSDDEKQKERLSIDP